jgi:hypothetical protein
MICDNHPEEPREALLLLTQVQTGEVAKLCDVCWPATFAGMLDALPAAERPTPEGADVLAVEAAATPNADQNGTADGDATEAGSKPKAKRGRTPRAATT